MLYDYHMINDNNTADLRGALANLRREQPAAPVTPAPSNIARRAQANTKQLPNKYPGKCKRCNQWVARGAGHTKLVNGKWPVFHVGECPEKAAFVSKGVEIPIEQIPATGIYTVEIDGDHRTFRIVKQAEDDKFLPGQYILQVLNGPDNTSDYKGVGNFKANAFKPWAKDSQGSWVPFARILLADPESVLKAQNCWRCNRVLSTPESVIRGIGPECEKAL